ncbi:MAG: type III pantothenate kinase [Cyclobacteriaceae bacterium]|jgi:type III pantothenate kinase|nr:type III pantothenate kinase [Cytophagales bacterium]MCZ8328843.1 type III pantothenate kinase [Cyclobacteriaceae bacterium]
MKSLVFDIGNTDITIGVGYGAEWQHVFRLPSDLSKKSVYYFDSLRTLFLEHHLAFDKLELVVISSVVPDLTGQIQEAIHNLAEQKAIVLQAETFSKLPITVLNPEQIGSDLVCNALAAFTHYKTACLVVDFGTALTFTTITDDGQIAGVAILPGLKTSIKALTQNTARLFEVPLKVPASVLGKDTTHAIQAGVLIGYEGLVLHMINRIKTELNKPDLPVMATGGLSSILPIVKDTFTDVNPMLTLDGLRLAGEILKSS